MKVKKILKNEKTVGKGVSNLHSTFRYVFLLIEGGIPLEAAMKDKKNRVKEQWQ